jgi:serine/threonine protein kinase
MPGENLYSLLRSSAEFGWNRLGKHIILDIAKAVVYLHSIGIIRESTFSSLTPAYPPNFLLSHCPGYLKLFYGAQLPISSL